MSSNKQHFLAIFRRILMTQTLTYLLLSDHNAQTKVASLIFLFRKITVSSLHWKNKGVFVKHKNVIVLSASH